MKLKIICNKLPLCGVFLAPTNILLTSISKSISLEDKMFSFNPLRESQYWETKQYMKQVKVYIYQYVFRRSKSVKLYRLRY